MSNAAIKVDVFPEWQTAVVHLSGMVTTSDVLHTTMALLDHPDWQPGFSEVWHALEVTSTVVDLDEVRAALLVDQSLQDRVGDGRVAGVVRREMDHIVGKLYKALSRSLSRREYEVFWKLEDALRWLGLDHLPGSTSAT